MSSAHVWLIYPIGHVYAEPELEVPTEQVQVEDFTNLKLTQGKPRCILPCSLSFNLNIYYLFYIWLGIKFIRIGLHSSCIKTDLPIYPCYPHLVVAHH
jgi:hypothetical protein